MPNFFIEKDQIEENSIKISGELFRHLKASLRVQKGEKIFCVDDEANRYTVEVTLIGRDALVGSIIEKEKRENPLSTHIHIAQAIPKGPKFDFIIQKSTELGVSRITPVISERSVVRLEETGIEDKLRRWRKIALEAAQQSNRLDVPDISHPVTLPEFLSSFEKGDLNLLLWEGEKRQGIKDVLKGFQEVKNVVILIGPEGGFSAGEVGMAVAEGFIPVFLGELILRTETAPVVALTILQYEIGYIGKGVH